MHLIAKLTRLPALKHPMGKKTKVKLTLFAVLCLLFIYFLTIPEYIILSDINMTTGQNREVILETVVYKAKYNPILYNEIKDRHTQVNGVPDKIYLRLYHTQNAIQNGRRPYRTVVYDFNHKISYILLDKW